MIKLARSLIAAIALIGAASVGVATPAAAQTAPTVTIGYTGTETFHAKPDTIFLGQQTALPPSAKRLQAYSLGLFFSSYDVTLVPVVLQLDLSGNGYSEVWRGQPFTVSAQSPDNLYSVDMDIAVDPSRSYVLGVEFTELSSGPGIIGTLDHGNLDQFSVLKDGDGSYEAAKRYSMTFSATFSTVDAIPTLSEWAMILFGISLAGAAAVVVTRRRRAA